MTKLNAEFAQGGDDKKSLFFSSEPLTAFFLNAGAIDICGNLVAPEDDDEKDEVGRGEN